MTERVLKFGGIDPISRTEHERGDREPETDPRGAQGVKVMRGMHLMSAVEQLEPATATSMAYLRPGSEYGSLEELEEAVRAGNTTLGSEMTMTERFTPVVNPRRSRLKDRGELADDSDADLWHVPTDNYNVTAPRDAFGPLARAIDSNDAIGNAGVRGEFRERRAGGEVFGEVWFEDLDVGAIDGDPVRLGLRFGYNYFGDRSFFIQPWAQQTRCKNSIAPLADKETVMAHRKNKNWSEIWDGFIRDLGVYGDELSQMILEASELDMEFRESAETGDLDPDGPTVLPMSLEDFYDYIGLPDPVIPARHARESGDGSQTAWSVHSGATYWLSWHWSGAEDSRAFREYRRTANDLLFNPMEMVGRARAAYENDVERRVTEDVLGPGGDRSEATEEEREEIERRLSDHTGLATMEAAETSLADKVEEFEDTEDRLERMQEAVAQR